MNDMLSPAIGYEDYITLFFAEISDTEVDIHTEDGDYDGARVWRIGDEDVTIVFGLDRITIPFTAIWEVVKSS